VTERQEILKGTLDLLILHSLNRGAMHGYGVARWIEEQTEGALVIEEGSLYPSLYRMEKRGWVKPRWGTSENNRKAKYYELTARGRKRVQQEADNWTRVARAIGRVVEEGTA
jgi:PadR family transcriptional regulator PadR